MPSPLETRLLRLEAARSVTPWDAFLSAPIAEWPEPALCGFLVALDAGSGPSRQALGKLPDERLDELITFIRAQLRAGGATDTETTTGGDPANLAGDHPYV